MKPSSLNIELNVSQIIKLVKQLPRKDKIRLSKVLEKEVINDKLSRLLKVFKNDKINEEDILNECNEVRSLLYAKPNR